MLNISKCTKENILLCAPGLVVLAYLGYHAVCWIMHKCQRIEKVNQVIQKMSELIFAHSSRSLVNRVSSVEISQGTMTMGQGEYIVFHQLPNGEKRPVSNETFEKVYKVLLQYSPAALANSGSDTAIEACANRYELLKANLREIDPTLEAVFVPRTLYELVFIRNCIQEDLAHNKICRYLSPSLQEIDVQLFENNQQQYEKCLINKEAEQKLRKCWHLCYFTDMGDNEHSGVKAVAYRLNEVMLNAFNPSSEGFTHQELLSFAEKEMEFLKEHHKNVNAVSSSSTPGPTTNFGPDSTRGEIKPMGIRHETDAQIIRNALALDCSKIAQHAFFLYRGANFQKDSSTCWTDHDTPYSLSFGTSLFAGCLYDGGATAFHYMRNGQNAYAIPVPFEQLNDSPFFIPTTHTVAQLFGNGEIFHARTKAWKDFDVHQIGGMQINVNGHIRDHLRSQLSQEVLCTQFRAYKNKAFQLK